MFVTIPPKYNIPISQEQEEKIRRSEKETAGLQFRPIYCPYCKIYLFDVFEDIRGHIAVKCNKCKSIVPINPAYFKKYSALGRYRRKRRNLL